MWAALAAFGPLGISSLEISIRPYPLTVPTEHPGEILETEGDLCIRAINLEEGQVVPQHAHDFGHTTYLAHGSVAMWLEGVYQGDFKAPWLRYVEPNKVHTYQALEDSALACISKQEK